MTMNAEEFAHWRYERKKVDDLLARIERAECAILTELGCPTDPVSVYAILNGEQDAPWPKRTAASAKQRALHAMHTLLHLAATRGHLQLGRDNARLAAHEALLTGLFANSRSIDAAIGRSYRAKQRAVAQNARAATQHDREIARHVKRWESSQNLQDDYGDRSPVNYVQKMTGLQRRTIQRAIARLRPQSRQ